MATISNLDQFRAELNKLPKQISDKLERKVLREAAKDMAMYVAAAAPQGDTGNLEQSIVSQKISKKYLGAPEDIAYGVFARRTKRQPGGYYLHLADRGHRVVTRVGRLKLLKVHGFKQGSNFVERTFNQYQQQVAEGIEKAVAEELEKANK